MTLIRFIATFFIINYVVIPPKPACRIGETTSQRYKSINNQERALRPKTGPSSHMYIDITGCGNDSHLLPISYTHEESAVHRNISNEATDRLLMGTWNQKKIPKMPEHAREELAMHSNNLIGGWMIRTSSLTFKETGDPPNPKCTMSYLFPFPQKTCGFQPVSKG